jgi:hypothetical protein
MEEYYKVASSPRVGKVAYQNWMEKKHRGFKLDTSKITVLNQLSKQVNIIIIIST